MLLSNGSISLLPSFGEKVARRAPDEGDVGLTNRHVTSEAL